MALTYRSEKGSALTNTELDNNFRHFTGSQTINGKLSVSGSAEFSGSVNLNNNLIVTGSNVNMANLPTTEAGATVGGLWLSGSTGVNSKYLVVRTA